MAIGSPAAPDVILFFEGIHMTTHSLFPTTFERVHDDMKFYWGAAQNYPNSIALFGDPVDAPCKLPDCVLDSVVVLKYPIPQWDGV
jgi:hypothetical protein